MLTGAKSLLTGEYGEERSVALVAAGEGQEENNEAAAGFGGADDGAAAGGEEGTGGGAAAVAGDEEQQAAVQEQAVEVPIGSSGIYDMKETASVASDSVVDGVVAAAKEGCGCGDDDDGSGGTGSASKNGDGKNEAEDGGEDVDDDGQIVKGEEKNPVSSIIALFHAELLSIGFFFNHACSIIWHRSATKTTAS